MLNRKLLEVLKRLDETEHKRLRLFLASPYFNSGSAAGTTLSLYDLIIRHRAEEEHPALAKEAVSRTLFPSHVFHEKSKGPVDAVASELFRLVRLFISQKEMERENGEGYTHLALARFYRKHALEERFWQSMETSRKIHVEFPWRDTQYYYQQFRIEEEENTFRGMYNSHDNDANLRAAHLNLDLFYSMMKLELTCALEHQKRHAQIDWDTSDKLIASILATVDEAGPLDVPMNHMYRLVLKILQSPDEHLGIKYLENLERLLDQHRHQIPPDKFNEFKAYSRFYWVNHYHKFGDSESRLNVFTVYETHLKAGYLYIDNAIPYTTSRNLVVFALKLGKTDWVQQFLETHPPERICGTRYPAEIHSLNTAEYYLTLKQYDKALDTLVYRLFENPTYSILADVLLVKIYYETQSELLAPRMKALDQKVRRSKQTMEVKERYLNFLRKLDKIIKYGWQKRSAKRDKLIEEIKSTQEIIAREWLLEQLAKK